MPEAITVTGTPFQSPVCPCTPRTLLTSTGSVKKVSAMNFARSGSPGIKTVLAKSSFSALIWGVEIIADASSVQIYFQYNKKK